MTCSIKSIRVTPTDAQAITKSWEKSDAGYSEMAAAFDGALAIASDAIFLQI
ncbi:MAG: hypothetical protein WA849_18050 [Candidatus Udaeobacter sp.]